MWRGVAGGLRQTGPFPRKICPTDGERIARPVRATTTRLICAIPSTTQSSDPRARTPPPSTTRPFHLPCVTVSVQKQTVVRQHRVALRGAAGEGHASVDFLAELHDAAGIAPQPLSRLNNRVVAIG